jgi:hypothetical protein
MFPGGEYRQLMTIVVPQEALPHPISIEVRHTSWV